MEMGTGRKGRSGIEQRGGALAAVASPDPLPSLLGSSAKPPSHWTGKCDSRAQGDRVVTVGFPGTGKIQWGWHPPDTD